MSSRTLSTSATKYRNDIDAHWCGQQWSIAPASYASLFTNAKSGWVGRDLKDLEQPPLPLDHRITEWLRLEVTSEDSSIPLTKLDHLEPLTEDDVQLLNVSKEGDFTTTLVNLCQCSIIRTVKKCFLMFRWNFLFLLVPIASYPVTCHHWKDPGSVLFAPETSLLWAEESQLAQPSL